MAFPTMLYVTLQVVLLVVGVPVVYLLSKALKLRPKPFTIADPKKEIGLAFLVIIAVFVVVSALHIFKQAIVLPVFHFNQLVPPFSFDIFTVLYFLFFYAVVLLPLIVVMRRTGQDLGSIGINRKDIWRMLALGFMVSAIYLAVTGFLAPSLGGGFAGFSSSLAYGFIAYSINGFSEEIVWRGYIQRRLTSYSGTLKGLVVTSLLFAFWHFPRCYYEFSGVIPEAFVWSLTRFSSGLLFGYIMLRSKNIIPSSIFHLFGNWSTLLWQTPY